MFFAVAVHPRGCGEHRKVWLPRPCGVGSSPRVRGTPDTGRHRLDAVRFIPAGAGNTWPGTYCTNQAAVHPRGCGEHTLPNSTKARCIGSSPRVRGTLSRCPLLLLVTRFIPAGAGNTAPFTSEEMLSAVHPRGCGEHIRREQHNGREHGSSPRVRGTHVDRIPRRVV